MRGVRGRRCVASSDGHVALVAARRRPQETQRLVNRSCPVPTTDDAQQLAGVLHGTRTASQGAATGRTPAADHGGGREQHDNAIDGVQQPFTQDRGRRCPVSGHHVVRLVASTQGVIPTHPGRAQRTIISDIKYRSPRMRWA